MEQNVIRKILSTTSSKQKTITNPISIVEQTNLQIINCWKVCSANFLYFPLQLSSSAELQVQVGKLWRFNSHCLSPQSGLGLFSPMYGRGAWNLDLISRWRRTSSFLSTYRRSGTWRRCIKTTPRITRVWGRPGGCEATYIHCSPGFINSFHLGIGEKVLGYLNGSKMCHK